MNSKTKPADDIAAYFRRSREAMQRAETDTALSQSIAEIAKRVAQSLRNGGKLMLAGNGGSAADAQHIAAELLSRFRRDRHPLPAIALTTDTSVLTAIGNDYGYELVFERQVRGLGRKGDVFIGITTSGRSPNITAALLAARERGLVTIGFTGTGGSMLAPLCDLMLIAPSDETAIIQQIHITAAHAICGLIETELFGASS
jgi:D-sedoheptulose 7-phosphate isomerase